MDIWIKYDDKIILRWQSPLEASELVSISLLSKTNYSGFILI